MSIFLEVVYFFRRRARDQGKMDVLRAYFIHNKPIEIIRNEVRTGTDGYNAYYLDGIYTGIRIVENYLKGSDL